MFWTEETGWGEEDERADQRRVIGSKSCGDTAAEGISDQVELFRAGP